MAGCIQRWVTEETCQTNHIFEPRYDVKEVAATSKETIYVKDVCKYCGIEIKR